MTEEPIINMIKVLENVINSKMHSFALIHGNNVKSLDTDNVGAYTGNFLQSDIYLAA